LTLLIVTYSVAQKSKAKHSWTDTTYIQVNLIDTLKDNKIVVINIGEKATIYLSKTRFRQIAAKNSNDYNKKELSEIIQFLDKTSLTRDTISIDQFMMGLDYLISEELQDGNAKVFYKKVNSFIPTISHRLEKYGMYAHRFFYLPDKRPFFSTMEYSGIIEKGKYFSDPNELVKLGEKLASLRKL